MLEEVKVLTDAEILAQVAEKVLGRYKSTVGGVPVWAARYDDYLLMKNFHLDWRLIGLVVEAMRGKGWYIELHESVNGWRCLWWDEHSSMNFFDVEAPTAPRAVLLAALKALEGK